MRHIRLEEDEVHLDSNAAFFGDHVNPSVRDEHLDGHQAVLLVDNPEHGGEFD